MSSQMHAVSVRNVHVWLFNQIKDITRVEGSLILFISTNQTEMRIRKWRKCSV